MPTYHQMQYKPKENKYIISKLAPSKNMDISKIDEVMKYSYNLWVAKRKQDLIDHAEEMKANKITQYKNMIRKINSGKVIVI